MFTYIGVIVFFLLLVGLGWDISRRRAAAVKRQQELEPYAKLGEGMEGVAHDSRKLLRAARLSMERLEHIDGLDPEADKVLRLALAQVQQADSFLQALGSTPDNVQLLDAVACMRLVISLHSRRKQIDASELEADALPLEGTPRDLARLLSNLLGNALEHAGQAEVSAAPGARTLRVSNALSGPDPGPEIYQRGLSSGGARQGNSGLGLALAQELAQRLDARLTHQVADRGAQRWISFVLEFSASDHQGVGAA